MNTDDILQIEQLYAFYEQGLATGDYARLHHLFSCAPDVSFLVLRTETPIVGHAAIEQNFLNYLPGSPDYDTFHTGSMVCTPLIEVEADGLYARAMFPTHGFFLCSQPMYYRGPENDKPPFPGDSTFEMWFDDFVKEDGVWKILHFNFISMTAQTIWRWDAAHDDGLAARSAFRRLGRPPFDLQKYIKGAVS